MKLLAIDTSTDYLSLAIMDGEKALKRIHKSVPRSHSSLLMPMIDRILKRSKMKLKDIDGFCFSVGPGSFTGLRIGAITIKGLAFVTKKPIAAVPTFDAIADNAKRLNGILCTVLDARKNKVYACIYKSSGKVMKKVSGYLLVPVDELIGKLKKYDGVVFMGDFAERAAQLLPGSKISTVPWQPKPEVVGRIGAGYFKKRKFVKAEELEPLYIYTRECDITGK